ncbi:MAG: hypothetical protein II595_10175, partial [Desulfovibrio sp.]|nr:hypothetical protein [Desulfovibrio sp.]
MDGWIGITHDLTNLDDNAIISGNELAPAEIKFYGKGKFYFSQPLSHREGNEVAFPEFTISGNFYNAEGNRAYENSLMYYNESYSPKILEFGRFMPAGQGRPLPGKAGGGLGNHAPGGLGAGLETGCNLEQHGA